MKSTLHKNRITKTQSLKILSNIIPPPKTIIDVGVLYGTYELVQTFPYAHYVLFEPVRQHHEKINKNYTKWKINYSLVPCAVSNKCGQTQLKTWSIYSDQDISHAKIDNSNQSANMPTVATVETIPMITLDSFIESQPILYPLLLKVDIDGLEYEVLDGARQTLEKCSAVVVEARPSNFDAISAIMMQQKFKLFDIVDFCYFENTLAQFDLCFINSTIWQTCLTHKKKFDINKWACYPRDIYKDT